MKKRRLYFDWSGNKLHVIDDKANNGKMPKPGQSFHAVEEFYDFDELFDSLQDPTKARRGWQGKYEIIGEPSFESFATERRQEIVDMAKHGGHDLFTIPSRKTGYRRKNLGFKAEDKCDALDVYVIRDIANDKRTKLKKARVYDGSEPLVKARIAASTKLMRLRSLTAKVNKRVKTIGGRGYSRVKRKRLYAKKIIQQLPKYKDLDDVKKMVLGNGKSYADVVVAAVAVATEYTKNRDDFTMVVGLLDFGYPSILRSDLMRHVWVNKLRINLPSLPKSHKKMQKPNFFGKVTPNQFQNTIRWLRSRIIEINGGGQPSLRSNADKCTSVAIAS